MKFGLPISIILHTALIFGGMVMWGGPVLELPNTKIIELDMITVSESTNIKRTIKKPEPKPADPKPDTTPEPTPDPSADADPVKTAEVIPELPTNEKADTPSEPTTPVFDLDALADQFKDIREDNPDANTQTTLSNELGIVEYGDTTRDGAGVGTGSTASIQDYVREKMRRYWSIDEGAKDFQKLRTEVEIKFDPLGNVVSIDVLNNAQIIASSNNSWRAARDKVLVALREAAPYSQLTDQPYQDWKVVILNFQPET